MPLEKVGAEDAFARIRRNRERMYPSEKVGRERLMPFARPATRAGFTFDTTSRIFTAGSCFARNIEKSLNAGNFNVVSSPTDIPAPESANVTFQLYNKYTIHSILNEVRWALNGCDHDALVIDGPKGKSYDLQVSASITGTRDEMLTFRRAFNASFAAAKTADVVIFTLGLIECWFDVEQGVYLNGAPPPPLVKAYPERFEFHLLDYDDILEALRSLYALLAEGRETPPKFLVTVSPVGLVSTFRNQDVLVANCYSKSVQRAAVEAFVAETEAHYFPSYEYVTLTDRKFAWGNHDFRHVRAETVDRIMADVLKAYVGESEGQSLLDTRGRSTALFENGEYLETIEVIEAHLAKYGEQEDILWLLARALKKERRQEDSLATCRRVIALDGKLSRSAGRAAIHTARQIGDQIAAEQIFEWYVDRFPEDEVEDLRPSFEEDLGNGLDADRSHVRRLFDDGAFEDACKFGEDALSRHGDDEEILWFMARSQ